MPCVQIKVTNNEIILDGLWVLAPGEWKRSTSIKGGTLTIKDTAIHNCNALIDTGATHSCISNRVASSLKLEPKNKIAIQGVHGVAERNEYDADLVFLGLRFAIENISVVDFPVEDNSRFDLIIGMDILLRGSLHLNYGSNGELPVCTFCI